MGNYSVNTARSRPDSLSGSDPSCVAGRYSVQALLGRGGMASAYRVYDKVNKNTLALKMLCVDDSDDDDKKSYMTTLFEREFHTLVQLAHPRVVQVFDYGVDQGTPYYTMELLDGGDLRELSPMPWQEVCTVAYEVCSVLSLLHSRRLIHRDLTPRNIRRTAGGKAKVFDFGLIAPLGTVGLREGTPQYLAPESLMKTSLDGRSDLFSLGATLYYALTGETAFRARSFRVLPDLWRSPPLPPSRLVPDIPPAVDKLVLDLLRIDVGSRPKSAAEVMDRLLPLMQTTPGEELSAARAHLATPQLIGRNDVIMRFRKCLVRAVRRRGGGYLISGESGAGRSRILDAFVLEAKLVGAITLRADRTNAANGPFGVAAALVSQLLEAAPSSVLEAAREHLKPLDAFTAESNEKRNIKHSLGPRRKSFSLISINRPELDRTQLQAALRAWFLHLAAECLIAIAVDDIDLIDEPSASLLASLSWEASRQRLVYAVTVESAHLGSARTALSLFQEHATPIALSLLGQEQITELLKSLFGDVPHLQLLSDRLYALCGGRPRDCMNLAQHLVNRGAISYRGGTWELPVELTSEELPASVEEAVKKRISDLSPTARRVALMLAVGLEGWLSRTDMMWMEGITSETLDKALYELFIAQMIDGSPLGYSLHHGNPKHLLISHASDSELSQIHEELSRIYKLSNRNSVAVVYHLLQSSKPEEGLDQLLSLATDSAAMHGLVENAEMTLGSRNTARTFELSLNQADRLNRSVKERERLWVLLAGMGARGENADYYYRVAPAWLEQLKRDSGFYDWQKLGDDIDPATRAVRAFTAVSERYDATPIDERVQEPIQAIKDMVSYVVFSIAVSVRVFDIELVVSLPALLQPFAPLSPIVDAMLFNALGTQYYLLNRREKSKELYQEVLKRLDAISGDELAYVSKIRAAIFFALANNDAALGIRSNWIELLEHEEQDPNQRVSVCYIRKVAALQQGNWELAEKHRQQAELLALQSKARSMFSTLWQEMEAHAMACDLTGLKQLQAGFDDMATRYPGWEVPRLICAAHFARQCGDLQGALCALEEVRALQSNRTINATWNAPIITIEVELLVAMERAGEALRLGYGALEELRIDGLCFNARNLLCAIALAEAKLGNHEKAFSLVESVIEEQQAIGVTGLQLGRSYEHGARIAIWANDKVAFKKYTDLTAQQYRPGVSSVLGALYERLMEEARRTDLDVDAELQCAFSEQKLKTATSYTHVTQAMAGCVNRSERAHRALAVLCDGQPSSRGYLFLIDKDGLVLSASNTKCEEMEDLIGFARRHIELEIDDSACTMTVDDVAAALQTDNSRGIWKDRDGTRYHAIMLNSETDDGSRVVGVAMLTNIDGHERIASVLQLASALARNLIDSGDTDGVLAV
ncbi:MAG: protein kinase [Deltaproteobacteria bacterium]|nr:protein kinase [Deltaproteobacteria bacterium]